MSCIVCQGQLLSVLDLGSQPLANDYTDHPDTPQQTFPLHLHRCQNCSHAQITHYVDPDVLFKNYIYTSGTSQTGLDYFERFCAALHKDRPLKVLDIACNDASQLDCFKRLGHITVGVDPAENLGIISKAKGHDVYVDFFNPTLAEKILLDYGTFDIIIAQNVFAHVANPKEFLEGCKVLMGDKTDLYIQTSQAKMIERGEFDTIYHEHISFFNQNSMNELCKRTSLTLMSTELVDIHGTSYLFRIKTRGGETREYDEYTRKCIGFKTRLLDWIARQKADGKRIIGFGSTAKSNTVLNMAGVTSKDIAFIIDENPLKQGKYTPGSRIPIRPISSISALSESNEIILVLAWNYLDEIISKLVRVKGYVEYKCISHL
jgi:2-polyprenyl-3-methyl-5-hydroxy-6-metoxy-1,4-benzoquinol methylase